MAAEDGIDGSLDLSDNRFDCFSSSGTSDSSVVHRRSGRFSCSSSSSDSPSQQLPSGASSVRASAGSGGGALVPLPGARDESSQVFVKLLKIDNATPNDKPCIIDDLVFCSVRSNWA